MIEEEREVAVDAALKSKTKSKIPHKPKKIEETPQQLSLPTALDSITASSATAAVGEEKPVVVDSFATAGSSEGSEGEGLSVEEMQAIGDLALGSSVTSLILTVLIMSTYQNICIGST